MPYHSTAAQVIGRPGLLVVALALTLSANQAYGVREHYEYRISWNGVPAANTSITLQASDPSAPHIKEVQMRMATNRVVDLLWMLRAHGRAEVDTDSWRPRYFVFDRRINDRPELTSIVLDSDGNLLGRYQRPGRSRVLIDSGIASLDPVTAILRAQEELAPLGETRTYEVFTGEARYRIGLRCAGFERIRVPAGEFLAARVEPSLWRLDRDKQDTRVQRLMIWVTREAPHRVLRMRSELFVGAIYLDLIKRSVSDSADTPEPARSAQAVLVH